MANRTYKFKPDDIRAILASEDPPRILADKYNVNLATIYRVLNGKIHKRIYNEYHNLELLTNINESSYNPEFRSVYYYHFIPRGKGGQEALIASFGDLQIVTSVKYGTSYHKYNSVIKGERITYEKYLFLLQRHKLIYKNAKQKDI